MKLLDYGCMLAFTIMLSSGQALFKYVGLTLREGGEGGPIQRVLCEPSLYVALAIYGVATLLWIWILSRVSLAQAYPCVALGMVIVPALGWLLFGETLTPRFWCGVALIVAGIGLTQTAAAG